MANFLADNSTLALLEREEGFRANAYWDVSQYSIGYGSGTMPNGQKVKDGDTITKEAARELLRKLIDTQYGATVNRVITANINRNQWNALVSLCYNIGQGNFSGSTLVKVVNQNPNNFDAIETQFLRWVNAGGNYLPALRDRRMREIWVYRSSSANGFFLS